MAKIHFPPVFHVETEINENPTWLLAAPGWFSEAESVQQVAPGGAKPGYRIVLQNQEHPPVLVVRSQPAPPDEDYVLFIPRTIDPNSEHIDLTHGTWLVHPLKKPIADLPREAENIRQSWIGAFVYKEDGADGASGLRAPQLGALHAVQAHWAVSDMPATVVMPTGTGKTDTMISILTATRCNRLLVVVPTDALRTQLASKFITLGVLPQYQILRGDAKYPIVAQLAHRLNTADEVDEVFSPCNVIVATM